MNKSKFFSRQISDKKRFPKKFLLIILYIDGSLENIHKKWNKSGVNCHKFSFLITKNFFAHFPLKNLIETIKN